MKKQPSKTRSQSQNSLIHSLTPLSVAGALPANQPNSVIGHFVFQNDQKEPILKESGQNKAPSSLRFLTEQKVFVGALKSMSFVRSTEEGQSSFLAIGLGAINTFSPEKARQTGALVYSKLIAEKISHFGIHFESLTVGLSKSESIASIASFCEGFLLASYTFEKHKSKPPAGHRLDQIILIASDQKTQTLLKDIATKVLITVDCVFTARDFSNEPSNHGTPTFFANEISALAKRFGMKCRVLGEAEAKKENMNLFLSVGAGSERESKVVILEVNPTEKKSKPKTVALVGKGVTFDSGGISLKPSARMEDMKHDMSGASSIFGATLLAARLGQKFGLENKIVTVLVFAENMPSGQATQPGNVIRARNGKTVEIINTDAEGRLVLADALDLAQDYQPDVVLNAATLTGACSVALGKLASALFSNDDDVAEKIQKSCSTTEERLWQLPLFDEYFDDLKTGCADMANSANDSNGGTIRGAIFLKQFIRDGVKWAHIDLANTAYDIGFLPYNPRKGATGSFVRTIADFATRY